MNYIFDFGGTLAETKKTTPKIINSFQQLIAESLNISLSRVKKAESLMNRYKSDLFSYEARIKMNTLALEKIAHIKWFEGILQYLGEDIGSNFNLIEKLCKMNMTEIEYYLYKDTVSCLIQIKKMGNHSYILSNGLPSKRQEIEKLGLDKIVDKIFISSKLSCEKPSPQIYQFVLNNLHIKASETIFVDNLIENVETADLLGIRSFRIVREKEVSSSKWDISSLTEAIIKS